MLKKFKNLRYALAGALLLFCAAVQAQTISGNVKDSNGEAIIGATIMEAGTKNGTVTDFDGNFTIKLQKAGDLNISYVGMKTQVVKTSGKSSVNVVLQDDNTTLNDVVVVGYGTMKKKDLTGAVGSVKADDLSKVASANALSAMQAKVPGVDLQASDGQAGSGVSMTLRGNRSLLASNNPLVIVDGVEYGSTLDIPASEIESMDILKDASSTAIYGTKGANGVIIITTKRGKEGNTKVGFNAYWSFNSPTNVVKPMYGDKEVQRLIDGANYITASQNGWDFSKGTATAESVLSGTSIADGTAMIDIVKTGSYTDWLDQILTNSTSQSYEVNVSGGSQKTNFNVALSLMNDKGLMENDQMKRYTGRANIDHQISKIFKIGTSLSFAYKDNNKRNSGVYSQALKMTTITHAYLNDGSVNSTPNPFYPSHCSPLLDDVDDGQRYQRNVETTRFFGSAYLQVTPIKDLTLKSNFTLDRSNERDGSYMDYASQQRYQTGNANSYISVANEYDTKYVWQNTANYMLNLNNKHDFNFLIGHEMSQQVVETNSISGLTAQEHYYQSSFYNLSNLTTAINPGSSYTKTAMVSFFGRVNYSLLDRYLFQASLRADGSSVLAEGKKWGAFPSVSAGWRITEEKFMQGTKSWLDNLKLRVSWGLSGNAAIDAYQTLAKVDALLYNSTDYVPMSTANKDLTWEKTSAFDIGLDFGFLGGRINGTIDYYSTKTYDLLYYKKAPSSQVFASSLANVGETKGHGWEFAINAVPVQSKNFRWDVNFSATLPKDEVSSLGDGTDGILGSNGYTQLKVGQAVSTFWTYEATNCWGGLQANGKTEYENYKDEMAAKGITVEDYSSTYGKPGTIRVIDQNGDGKINSEDKVYRDQSPKAILGMTNTFSYKGFSLSFQMMARLGGYMYYQGNSLITYDGANWGDLNYWTPTNTDTKIPSPTDNSGTNKPDTELSNAICIENASYFKIKDITLSYSFDKKLIAPLLLSNARIYCSLKNFITAGAISGYDSERRGAVSFPLAKQVVVGINVTF